MPKRKKVVDIVAIREAVKRGELECYIVNDYVMVKDMQTEEQACLGKATRYTGYYGQTNGVELHQQRGSYS